MAYAVAFPCDFQDWAFQSCFLYGQRQHLKHLLAYQPPDRKPADELLIGWYSVECWFVFKGIEGISLASLLGCWTRVGKQNIFQQNMG